jgi:para-nitrobenzyl esterase
MRHFLLLFLALFLLAGESYAHRHNGETVLSPVVSTHYGKIQGLVIAQGRLVQFRGIPYAQAPVGSRRWKRPLPPKAWNDTLKAVTWPDIALQTDQDKGSFYEKEFFRFGMPRSSENCLFINITMPRKALAHNKALPVCVWYHGGAYQNGYSYEIEMDPTEWARRGIIFVSVGYRMGITGFLCHPELDKEVSDHSSGNYGTYDQVMALRWVHDNIASFGGDPLRITIMGQSAGGGSVKNLCASPVSRGMIAGAIIQSAGGLGNFLSGNDPADYMRSVGKMLMDSIGLTTLKKMRAADMEIVRDPWTMTRRHGINTMRVFAPHTGGDLLPESFDDAVLDNSVADVPYLIGYTADDMMPMDKAINRLASVRDSLSRKPVYSYKFCRRLPGDNAGAFHSSELWYTFGSLKYSWRPFTKKDYELSNRMLGYWTNFVKYGNPNKGKGSWRPNTSKDHYFQILDTDK